MWLKTAPQTRPKDPTQFTSKPWAAGKRQAQHASKIDLNLDPWFRKVERHSQPGPSQPWLNTSTESESTVESRDRSATPTSQSSASRTSFIEDQSREASTLAKGIFTPRPPPTREPLAKQPVLQPPSPRGGDSSSSVSEVVAASPDERDTSTAAVARDGVIKASQGIPPNVSGLNARVSSSSPRETMSARAVTQGRRNIKTQKFAATAGLIGANFIFIFATWWWPRFWFIYLPFITLPLVLNCLMIVSIVAFKLRNTIVEEKTNRPDHPETLIMVIPCYNETIDECTRSLDSLVDQTGIDDHMRAIMVICDGRVRGPGMNKTTADYLFEDILVGPSHREKMMGAYTGWNGDLMDIEVSQGTYKGVPFYCIVKEQNQGKRDSLIAIRSFLYKFNTRGSDPTHIFSSRFFASMTTWLANDVGLDHVDHLIGMDADTVFAPDCISQLLRESTYPHTVGVCGYVAVDFSGGSWNLWSLYQSAEYSIAQGLRRLHQSIATHKVSCLPGCCQLIRICETTCGDLVLVDLFGYHPKPTDGMLKQIRATASEDRNHVCLMLTTCPEAQTRQALRAKAYTDVPHSWSVFLSQRRRWTLGATSNDLLLFMARHCHWWERILAFSNVLTWCLNVFVIASIGCMVVAFMHQPVWIIMAFVGVMLVPLGYYVIMAVWLPRGFKERVQYLAGLGLFVFCGPFLNITVMIFAVWNMDSFGWGKTRKIVTDDESSGLEVDAPPELTSASAEHGSPEEGEDSLVRHGRKRHHGSEKGRSYDEESTGNAFASKTTKAASTRSTG